MTTENDLENSEKMEEDIELKVKEQNQQLMVQFFHDVNFFDVYTSRIHMGPPQGL